MTIKKLLLTSLAFVTAVFIPLLANSAETAALEYTITPVPEWTLKHRYSAEHAPSATQSSQYLLVDRQSKLYGTPKDYSRNVIRPLTNSGVDQDSEIKIDFNPAFQKLNIHRIKIIRNNRARDVTKTAKVRLIQQENQLSDDLLQGSATAIIILEDVRINDIIDYQYSLVGRNPVFGKKVFGNLSLSWSVYVDKLNIRLLSDRKRPLNIATHNSQLKPKVIKHAKTLEYIISKTGIKPVIDEQEYPHDYIPYAWLQYSEYSSWKDVSQWGMNLYKLRNKPSDKFISLVKRLKKKSKTDEEYIINALDFVQNDIRYLGLEFGENSHKPHSPNEVLEKRFGDCKDKSVLLNRLLAQNNIKAYPALVSTRLRGGISQQLASPGAFDHVISYVRHKGKSYWLDGTRNYQAGILDERGNIDYGSALVIGYSRLSDMYKKSPVSSKVAIREDIIASDFAGTVTLNIKTTYYRSLAEYMRYKFNNQSLELIQKDYNEFFKRYYDDITPVKKTTYFDNKKLNRFTVVESYQIKDYWKKSGNRLSSKIYVLSFIERLKAPKIKDRTSPYYLGSLVDIQHQTQVHYPEDVDLTFPSEPVIIKNDALEYRYTDHYANQTYTHKARLRFMKDQIQANKIDEYLSLLEQIKQGWSYTINFLDPTSITGYREILTLKKRLRELSE